MRLPRRRRRRRAEMITEDHQTKMPKLANDRAIDARGSDKYLQQQIASK